MEVYPELNIRVGAKHDRALREGMIARARGRWNYQRNDPHGRPGDDGDLFFHRGEDEVAPACVVCVTTETAGILQVSNIVPDGNAQLSVERYVALLREFDTAIANPAAEALGGMTDVGTARQTLDDHFSPRALGLLRRFCETSNVADRGRHLADQEKWMAFLIQAHHDGGDVHCDTFGACLAHSGFWPEDDCARLAREFDFAMRLLRQYDGRPRRAPG